MSDSRSTASGPECTDDGFSEDKRGYTPDLNVCREHIGLSHYRRTSISFFTSLDTNNESVF